MLSTFVLKVIAMLTMTVDHIGWMMPDHTILLAMTTIGRIAFLLYAFMTAEGFHHIKDRPERVRRQLVTLSVFTVFSEMAFDLMKFGTLVDWSTQSVMGVLLMGFVGLVLTERFRDRPWVFLSYYVVSAVLNYMCHMNFRAGGVLLIYFFYWFMQAKRDATFRQRLAVLIPAITVYYLFYTWGRVDFGGWSAYVAKLTESSPWILGHWVAMALIAGYSGERGWRNKVFDTVYAVYYPLHMAIIGCIRLLMGI